MKKRLTKIMITGFISFLTGFYFGGKMLVKMINDYKTRMNRNSANMMVMNDWLDFIYSGKSIETYFHNNGYKKIMVYGYGDLGGKLIQALSETDVKIAAIMDRTVSTAADTAENETPAVIGIDASIPDVDCIVVTPAFYFQDIYHMLSAKTDIPIVSISEIIENV